MLNKEKLTADFCVIGGGLAGVSAAVAAARNGLRVILMQERPVLGGNASSEIRMWVCGAQGKNNRESGIIEEIQLENLWRNPTRNPFIFDTIVEGLVRREKNIRVLLNCTCMDAKTRQGKYTFGRTVRILSVTGYQMTTQTFFEVEAPLFADCSGDSILAPLTGADFRVGRESREEYGENTHVEKSDSMTMGMSRLIQGRETDRFIAFTPPEWATKMSAKDFEHRKPNLYHSGENFWYLELGGNRDSIHDTEEISGELEELALGTWDHVKNSGEFHAENWELEFLGALPGKRESRRMRGEITVTQKDISERRQFEDTVAFGGWPLDDHFPAGFWHQGAPNTNFETPAPYPLPYRALYSKNVDNLFFAGRNISMTHMAMSSIRVMATCSLLGQAVGTAASLAAPLGLSPQGIYESHLADLQKRLMEADCFLPGFTRILSPLCDKTSVQPAIPDSARLKDGLDRPHRLYGGEDSADCGALLKNGEPVSYLFESPHKVETVHLVFDSDLNRDTLPGDRMEQTHTTRSNVRLDSAQMRLPKTLCRSFALELINADGTVNPLVLEDQNHRRFWHLPVNREISGIRFVPLSNWGDTGSTRVFSFDFC